MTVFKWWVLKQAMAESLPDFMVVGKKKKEKMIHIILDTFLWYLLQNYCNILYQVCATGCTASLAWKRREVPFWESHPGSSAFPSCKPSWLSVNVDAELLQQGDWIQVCYEAHESTETHQGNPGLPFTWQQFSYFVIIWLGTCLIWLIFFFFFFLHKTNSLSSSVKFEEVSAVYPAYH